MPRPWRLPWAKKGSSRLFDRCRRYGIILPMRKGLYRHRRHVRICSFTRNRKSAVGKLKSQQAVRQALYRFSIGEKTVCAKMQRIDLTHHAEFSEGIFYGLRDKIGNMSACQQSERKFLRGYGIDIVFLL